MPELGKVNMPTVGILKLSGITHEAALTTQRLCQQNHDRFDWRFNEKGFHNHLNHHVLAAYSFGASPQRLEDIFKIQERDLWPIPSIKTEITDGNFNQHIGKAEAYTAFLKFFVDRLNESGPQFVLEKYAFTRNGSQLFERMIAGVLHPLIESGYGAEFALNALLAEGLAQGCAHKPKTKPLFEDDFLPSSSLADYKAPSTSEIPQELEAAFNKTHLKDTYTPRKGVSAFDVVKDVLDDPSLDVEAQKLPRQLDELLLKKGETIRNHCTKWVVDSSGGAEEIAAKVEELIWLATVVYAAATPPGRPAQLDFFSMHSLTSSLFLPSLLRLLSHDNQVRLLHAHFRVQIAQWIARGRPSLHIKQTLMKATGSPSPSKNTAADPWKEIIAKACQHEDEHLVKTLRSLYFGQQHYGKSPKGYLACSLEGSQDLDGSAFVRAAGITLNTLGWDKMDKGWSFDGF